MTSNETFQVRIRYFASIKERLGIAEEKWTCNAGTTVRSLRDILVARGGAYEEALQRPKAVRCAVNHTMVDETSTIVDSVEIAFFPPVTGG